MFDPKTKILVVEDMTSFRKMVVSHLNEMGFSDISEAENGKIAWKLLQETKPGFGLILCDWVMPEMLGIELLKEVRCNPDFKNTPFVLVTTENERTQVLKAVGAGVSAMVVKPFERETLQQKLEELHKKLSGAKG